MTFLDDTPAEFDRHDMEADMEIEQRAGAADDYEFNLECLIAHEVNRTFDAALGESRR